jgi:hypothetical protein
MQGENYSATNIQVTHKVREHFARPLRKEGDNTGADFGYTGCETLGWINCRLVCKPRSDTTIRFSCTELGLCSGSGRLELGR